MDTNLNRFQFCSVCTFLLVLRELYSLVIVGLACSWKKNVEFMGVGGLSAYWCCQKCVPHNSCLLCNTDFKNGAMYVGGYKGSSLKLDCQREDRKITHIVADLLASLSSSHSFPKA